MKSLWTSKSTPDCIFVGYSETENLFELWYVHQKTIIRKRDIIFWEHQLGHPLLSQVALPHGVSIFTGVSGALIPAIGTPVDILSDLTNTLPLTLVPGRQSITRLPAKPIPAAGTGSDYVWEYTTPEDMANVVAASKARQGIRVIPILELNAFMETIDMETI